MGAVLSAFPALAQTGGTVTGPLTVNGALTTKGGQTLVGAAAGTSVEIAEVTGDAMARWNLNADGGLSWGPGTGATDTNLYRAFTAILQTDSTLQTGADLKVVNAGHGLFVKEGANAKQGTAVLTAGSSVVTDTAVTAVSRIFLTSQADGGAPGFLRVSARTAGTSFTITSSSGTDTSTVAYEIFEPA